MPTERQVYGPSLLDALHEKGGLLDQSGELSALGVDEARKPFAKKLIREGGLTLDRAAELMHEAGYLEDRDIGTLLAGLDAEVRGTPVFRSGRENPQLFDLSQQLGDLKHYLDELAISLDTTPNEAIKQLLEQQRQRPTAPTEGETFTQAREPAVVLTGHELGEFGSEVKAWKQAGLAFYRTLQEGPPAHHPVLGDVAFTRVGQNKLRHISATPLRWQMLPGLREIVARAELRDTQPAHGRRDSIVAFHWLETTVRVGERDYRVGVHVAEDVNGRKFYNLNEDLQAWRQKYQTPERTQAFNLGAQGSAAPEGAQDHQLGSQEPEEGEPDGPTFFQSVPPTENGINLAIQPLQQSAGDDAKGAITFGRGQINIQLLEGADLSTFIHETGHLYLNELIDDALTPGTPEALRQDLEAWAQKYQTPGGTAPFNARGQGQDP
ncbi:MAG: hypothetical protein NTNFB02_10280 [Nitrospira sp.]